MSYQVQSDFSGFESLLGAGARGSGAFSFKTFKDDKVTQARQTAGEALTGTGGELTTQAIGGTINLVTKTLKSKGAAAAKELLPEGTQDVLRQGGQLIENAQSVLADPAGAVTRLVGGATTAPGGGAETALSTKQLLAQRYQGLSAEGQEAVKTAVQQGVDSGDIAAAGQAKGVAATYQRFDQVSDIIGAQETKEGIGLAQAAGDSGLRTAGQVIGQGAEQRIGQLGGLAPKIGGTVEEATMNAASKVGTVEDVAKGVSTASKVLKGLDAVEAGSAATDENPVSLAVTAIAGIASAIVGGFLHHHKVDNTGQTQVINSRPVNFSYQAGL